MSPGQSGRGSNLIPENVVLKGRFKQTGQGRCLAIEDHGPSMLVSGANEIAYLHPDCAKSLSRRLIDDLSDLIDLGFKFEDG